MKYTKYEKARIIGARALQLAMGAPILLKLSPGELESIKFNPIEIAKREFEKDILPITIRRPLPQKATVEQ
ncbi:DNA-directed RNA polymerase subunit K [Candidatus Woesearchaeota archaeon]|nr:DNA-directed RNA polymerase subunit K [Candidatus Woesearchaeota archaeon]